MVLLKKIRKKKKNSDEIGGLCRILAVCPVSRLSDSSVRRVEDVVNVGEEIDVRIVYTNYFEGCVVVSAEKSFLSCKYSTIDDVKPGEIVYGGCKCTRLGNHC